MTEHAPGEPRDYRRIIDLVAGAVVTVVALVAALLALLLAVFSHQVISTSCDRAVGAVTCNGLLLGTGYGVALIGIAAAVIGLIGMQLRAYRREDGLWAWPMLSIGVVVCLLLVSVLLMRTAHPAAVGAVAG